jgi:pimeloyl-ACP methyl ester carboxylesterase
MKILLSLVVLLCCFSAHAQGDSLLNASATVTGYGQIRYRGPVNQRVNPLERPIVLIHGIYGGASHRTWRKLLPLLDAAGKEVYILDLPGVGESDKPKRSYSIEDFDVFLERFIEEVVRERANLVTESILSNSALRVSSTRPDLVRRVALISPTGIFTLNEPPSSREQNLYDRLFNDDEAAIGFYRNLLNPNSLRFFLAFAFFDDSLIDENLLADYSVLRENIDQRFLSLSFVGGQLYRSFEDSSKDVFVPVLGIFGAEYENFQDSRFATAADFQAVRPFFDYVEVQDAGSSVQREKPIETAKLILDFFIQD